MRRKVRIGALLLLAGLLAAGLAGCRKGPSSLHGAVLEQNSDPRKQSPIEGVEVAASVGSVSRTDTAGYFTLKLGRWVRSGQPVHLTFQRQGYQPLQLDTIIADRVYVVHMTPIAPKAERKTNRPPVPVSNVKIRYSLKTTAAVNVGSAVKTFEVVNIGNLPCNNRQPCSPNGKWKAAIGSTTLDAGEGNEFRNVRLSCIAGPCPFTRIESDGYSKGGNKIAASVLNWSDTTTFLLEAEVYHPMGNQVIQESYPVIFGRTLNFSVPDAAEGVSIQADVKGEALVFPLGPRLCLRWADCTVSTGKGQSKSYRCELKDGYAFRE